MSQGVFWLTGEDLRDFLDAEPCDDEPSKDDKPHTNDRMQTSGDGSTNVHESMPGRTGESIQHADSKIR